MKKFIMFLLLTLPLTACCPCYWRGWPGPGRHGRMGCNLSIFNSSHSHMFAGLLAVAAVGLVLHLMFSGSNTSTPQKDKKKKDTED